MSDTKEALFMKEWEAALLKAHVRVLEEHFQHASESQVLEMSRKLAELLSSPSNTVLTSAQQLRVWRQDHLVLSRKGTKDLAEAIEELEHRLNVKAAL